MQVVAKRLFEEAITRSGLDRISRALRNVRGAVLAYHNVVPTGERVRGEAALHIPQERFAAHLDAIRRTHDVVSLRRLLAGDDSSGRPKVAITFDDAYRGTITAGLQETSRRGLPATVFVAPGLLGRREFWWDRLADGSGSIEPDVREAALRDWGGAQDAILEGLAPATGGDAPGAAPMPMELQPCTVGELKHAVSAHAGLSIGSHTWSHRCLPCCNARTIDMELERSDQWLRSRFERHYVSCISYPYGRHSIDVTARSRRTYRWGLKIDGGLVPGANEESDESLLPRINVSRGLSEEGLLIRLSGLL